MAHGRASEVALRDERLGIEHVQRHHGEHAERDGPRRQPRGTSHDDREGPGHEQGAGEDRRRMAEQPRPGEAERVLVQEEPLEPAHQDDERQAHEGRGEDHEPALLASRLGASADPCAGHDDAGERGGSEQLPEPRPRVLGVREPRLMQDPFPAVEAGDELDRHEQGEQRVDRGEERGPFDRPQSAADDGALEPGRPGRDEGAERQRPERQRSDDHRRDVSRRIGERELLERRTHQVGEHGVGRPEEHREDQPDRQRDQHGTGQQPTRSA